MSESTSSEAKTTTSGTVQAEEKKFKFFTVFVPVTIGFMTLGLSLMGYGRDAGYLGEFGLTPEQLQRTPLDFLLRGHFGILGLIKFDMSYSQALFSREWLMNQWWSAQPTVLFFSIVAVATLAIAHRFPPIDRRQLELHNPRRPWWGHRVLCNLRSNESRDRRFRISLYSAPFVVAIVIPAILLSLAFLIHFIVDVLIVLNVLLPAGPADMGQHDAHTEVIDPTECRLIQSSAHGAHCIRVIRNGCEIARGRYIDQTQNRVWLYHKQGRNTSSAPLDGSVVEDVAIEDPQPIAQGCR